MKIELNRINQDVHFRASNEDGQTIDIDGSPEIGGVEAGPRPMQLLLMSLASCSSIDVCTILKKKRQQVESYRVVAEAERDTDNVPAVFKTIHLTFLLRGQLDEQKVKQAIRLSVEKYCSVAKMLEQTATITYEYHINKTD